MLRNSALPKPPSTVKVSVPVKKAALPRSTPTRPTSTTAQSAPKAASPRSQTATPRSSVSSLNSRSSISTASSFGSTVRSTDVRNLSRSRLASRATSKSDIGAEKEGKGTITRKMVFRRNILDYKSLSPDQAQKESEALTRIRLDREEISSIPNLASWFSRLTHLYLHHNYISNITHMDKLPHLKFLILSDNRIMSIHGLRGCLRLEVLDLSRNQISSANGDQCPPNVRYLLLADNPCSLLPSYRLGLIKDCERLEELDDLQITKQEKRMGRGEIAEDIEESDSEEEEETDDMKGEWTMSPSLYEERVNQIRLRSKGRRESSPLDSAKRLEDLRIKFKEDVIARLQIKS